MKRIIVNADDFGINDVVTSEIERQILAGNVSSTTVMANGSSLEEVKRFASQHPEVSFGVHLCLSEFSSITKSEGLYHADLTDENGQFIQKAIFHLKNLKDNMVQNAIREELNAQIDVVSSLRFPISHADSHHHVHTIYTLRGLFADVLEKRGISKIRIGADFRSFQTRRHILIWARRMVLNQYYKKLFTTADAFYSYSEYVKMMGREQVVELMCHPGHPEKKYRDEMELVELKIALKDGNTNLISYNELPVTDC